MTFQILAAPHSARERKLVNVVGIDHQDDV